MSDDITLRPLDLTDAPEMAQVLSNPDLYVFTGGEPPSEADLTRRRRAAAAGGIAFSAFLATSRSL